MENNSPANTAPKKKIVKRIVISVVLLFAVIFIGSKVYYAIKHEVTDNAQVEMRLVPILSRVSGYVDKIYLEDFASVKKGELINKEGQICRNLFFINNGLVKHYYHHKNRIFILRFFAENNFFTARISRRSSWVGQTGGGC